MCACASVCIICESACVSLKGQSPVCVHVERQDSLSQVQLPPVPRLLYSHSTRRTVTLSLLVVLQEIVYTYRCIPW